ncbi:hypothetical protein NFI96_004388 [Prochilodus magdalenae]|nr:hypothetical protein NFI96_004388 [Prochilodus magdalenae]
MTELTHLTMSGHPDGNKEFHEQLRLQELYGQKREDGADPYTYVDPEDGTVYDWDHDKKAWFPKITEDFMAAYQANYGFNEDGTPDPTASAPPEDPPPDKPQEEKKVEEEKKPDSSSTKEGKQKGEKRKAEAGWFDIETDKNTNVYVSGLPPDITPDEFVEVMSKCGIIMRDPITEEYKVKLYKDSEGNQKGDGLCCYLKRESVALAERLLDDSEIRGYRLHVEAARFELKGQYDASRKKKKSKEYRKKLQQQQKPRTLPRRADPEHCRAGQTPNTAAQGRPRTLPCRADPEHCRAGQTPNTAVHGRSRTLFSINLTAAVQQLDWRPEKTGDVRKRHERVVIIRNMFQPKDFEEDPLVLNEYRDDLRTECEKFGEVKKVILFDVEETSREREERLKGWSTFLADGKTAEAAAQAKDTEGKTEAGNTQGVEPVPVPPTDTTPSQPEDKTEAEQPEEAAVGSTDSSLAGSDDEA